ncbi:MAG: hypothetical protein KDC38_12950, partial [Planctomycetes bacterium]|nr:hypothetical protein [Planctomycetota bacterium]
LAAVTLPANPWLVDEDALRELWQGKTTVWLFAKQKQLSLVSNLGVDAFEVDRSGDFVLFRSKPLHRD